MSTFQLKSCDCTICTTEAEFTQYYISTYVEFKGRKRELLVLFEDPYDDIALDVDRFKVTGTLHETAVQEPLTLMNAKLI